MEVSKKTALWAVILILLAAVLYFTFNTPEAATAAQSAASAVSAPAQSAPASSGMVGGC